MSKQKWEKLLEKAKCETRIEFERGSLDRWKSKSQRLDEALESKQVFQVSIQLANSFKSYRVYRQTDRQTDRQAGRQTYRHFCETSIFGFRGSQNVKIWWKRRGSNFTQISYLLWWECKNKSKYIKPFEEEQSWKIKKITTAIYSILYTILVVYLIFK